MSRLDSFIRRITAQRDCLNSVAELIGDRPGLILELGLGNGRTFDHLRQLFPEKEIYVFERKVAAHPECVPDAEHLSVGDIQKTLPATLQRLGRSVFFAHADLGSGNPQIDAALATFVAATLPAFLLPGGVILSDQNLSPGSWSEAPLPPNIKPGRYYMYRAAT